MTQFNDLDARLLVDLLRDRIKPQKSLGQHFLVDENIISRSIEIAREFEKPITSQSHILEIGPGPGSLTLELLRSNARLTALEIDDETVSHLKRVFPNLDDRFVLNKQDALIGNWPSDITHLISNLPYQISSPALEKIQNHHLINPISIIILLVQDEFAERMAMKRFDTRGPLGMSLWLDFDVYLDRKVPSNCFSPAPGVNSRLVTLLPTMRNKLSIINRKLFRIIVKHCFSNRRRKIRTSLSKPPKRLNRVKGWHKEKWNKTILNVFSRTVDNLPEDWPNLRPEDLEPEHWVILTNTISSN
ncbi:MAG: ribosomal RNA small subunit methyltransferase A [Euryarchaeota archaeon]|nr:ribosomal RNA small subunit methyltransferase A [Euryarchaeota archaeon]